MNKSIKNFIFWLVILVSAIVLWQTVKSANNTSGGAPVHEISYSQFLSQVDAGNVAKVRISGTTVDGSNRDGGSFRVIVSPSQEQMLETLRQKNVEIWYARTGESSANWLINLAPLVLLAALWFLMIRQMKTRANAKADAGAATTSAQWQGK